MNSDDIVDNLVSQIQTTPTPIKRKRIINKHPEFRSTKRRRTKNTPKDDLFYKVTIPALTMDDFRVHFRMSRTCLQSIVTRVGNRCKIFSIEKKFMFTIWLLATRESFSAVGSRFCMGKGYSHQSFLDIVEGLIVLFKEYVAWPSVVELSHIEQGFKPNADVYVPGIVGAINSCHLLIRKPARYSIYCNNMDTHSIILQAVCDHQKIFTDVYVGAPGCLNAERAYNNSPLSKEIKDLIPPDYHIVGNDSFPQKQNLVVPFLDLGILSEREKRFNECLQWAHSRINDALQLLLARFRRLTFLDTSGPEMANKITVACIILHNHILMTDLDDDPTVFLEGMPGVYFNSEPDGSSASDDDPEGIAKRADLVSIFDLAALEEQFLN